MAEYRKIILTPNVYSVKTRKGRKLVPVTKTLLKNVAKTANEMIEAGLRIPAPFAHWDENGVAPSPLLDQETDAETNKKKIWSSDLNAGFWKKFEATNDGELAGYVDIADEYESKVGTTIKETSVFLEPEYTDGLGRTWSNALRHVALVTNAVEPNQKNFELVDTSPEYSLSMAFSMSDAVDSSSQEKPKESDTSDEKVKSDDSNDKDKDKLGSGNIPEIISLLKDKLGYEMPSDTTAENFLDRFRTLLTSIKKDELEDDEESFNKKPKSDEKPGGDDAEVRTSPVAMSDTNKTATTEVFEKKIPKLMEKLIETFKSAISARLDKLAMEGKLSKPKIESLRQELATLVMSLDDFDEETGEFKRTSLEEKLEMAEDLSGFYDEPTDKKPKGNTLSNDDGSTAPMTKEELDSIYNAAGF